VAQLVGDGVLHVVEALLVVRHRRQHLEGVAVGVEGNVGVEQLVGARVQGDQGDGQRAFGIRPVFEHHDGVGVVLRAT